MIKQINFKNYKNFITTQNEIQTNTLNNTENQLGSRFTKINDYTRKDCESLSRTLMTKFVMEYNDKLTD